MRLSGPKKDVHHSQFSSTSCSHILTHAKAKTRPYSPGRCTRIVKAACPCCQAAKNDGSGRVQSDDWYSDASPTVTGNDLSQQPMRLAPLSKAKPSANFISLSWLCMVNGQWYDKPVKKTRSRPWAITTHTERHIYCIVLGQAPSTPSEQMVAIASEEPELSSYVPAHVW